MPCCWKRPRPLAGCWAPCSPDACRASAGRGQRTTGRSARRGPGRRQEGTRPARGTSPGPFGRQTRWWEDGMGWDLIGRGSEWGWAAKSARRSKGDEEWGTKPESLDGFSDRLTTHSPASLTPRHSAQCPRHSDTQALTHLLTVAALDSLMRLNIKPTRKPSWSEANDEYCTCTPASMGMFCPSLVKAKTTSKCKPGGRL